MKYREQLLDERWKLKRAKIFKRDEYKCTKCNSDKDLNVHHLYYVKNHKAWEYPHNALITLCSKCHSDWHKKHKTEVREKVFSRTNREYKAPPKQKSNNVKKIHKEDKLVRQSDRLRREASFYGMDPSCNEIVDIISNNKYSVACHMIRMLAKDQGRVRVVPESDELFINESKNRIRLREELKNELLMGMDDDSRDRILNNLHQMTYREIKEYMKYRRRQIKIEAKEV